MNNFNFNFNHIFLANSVFELFSGIILIILSVIFLDKILKIHLSSKNKIIYFLTNLILFTFSLLFNNLFYGYLAITLFSMTFLTLKVKAPKIELWSFFSIVSIYALNLKFCFFRITTFPLLPIYALISTMLLAITYFIKCSISKKFKEDNLLINSINKNSNLIITTCTLNIIIVLTILAIFFETISQNILYILLLNIYFYASIRYLIDICTIEFMKQKIKNLKLCNETILNLYDETRAFKHDFHNIIQAIGGYVATNDIQGLRKYYKQISNDCKVSNNLSSLNPELVNNPAIYNILVDKYYIANNNDIKINLDIMVDLNKLNIKIYEFTRILGILLDNAIEASKECSEKSINISFRQDNYKQLIIIENTYLDKQISIDKIFEKDFSTKPNNTGLGLWEVRKILNKNTNLNLYTTKNNDYFSQQLEIYSA